MLCYSPRWYPNAITLLDNKTIDRSVGAIFLNDNNTLYTLERNIQQVRLWLEGSNTSVSNINGNFNDSQGLFVSTVGDVYIDNGKYNSRVEKWPMNMGTMQTVMNVSASCFRLFIDLNNAIYCSLDTLHQVISTSLNGGLTTPTLVAGNGSAGSASVMLSGPRGVFVDAAISLYVADCGNNRVQLFLTGQSNGSTLAGNGASGTTTLNCPIAVTLDWRRYLYILDRNNHRIVGSGPDGFRCLVGCTGINGSAPNQLSSPRSFSFDRQGNLIVNDLGNTRIQKFLVATNSCSEYRSGIFYLRNSTFRSII